MDKKRGEGVSQMSTIVHVREGGGIRNVHVDKMFGKCSILAPTCSHEFTFGNVNVGCNLFLHLGLPLGAYLFESDNKPVSWSKCTNKEAHYDCCFHPTIIVMTKKGGVTNVHVDIGRGLVKCPRLST